MSASDVFAKSRKPGRPKRDIAKELFGEEVVLSPAEQAVDAFLGASSFMAEFTKYDGDPVGFCENILGVTLWSRQKDVLIEVCSRPDTIHRVLVRAGHNVGKSFLAACLIAYWVWAHQGAVLTTGPGKNQVSGIIWKEFWSLVANAKYKLPTIGKPGKTGFDVHIGKKIWAKGTTAAKDGSGTKAAGHHHDRLLVIIDECFAVDEEFWEGLGSSAGSPGNAMLAIGNPTSKNTAAYRREVMPPSVDEKGRSTNWHVMTISCLDHPNIVEGKMVYSAAVSPQWVKDRLHEGGENGYAWRVRVLGEYALDDEGSVIASVESILRCVRTPGTLPPPETARLTRIIGVDVGSKTDPTTLCFLKGRWVERFETHFGLDTDAIAEKAFAAALEEEGSVIHLDSTGVGAAVAQKLKKMGARYLDVYFNGAPLDKKDGQRLYRNRRAEMYWAVQRSIGEMELSLPNDMTAARSVTNMLIEELAATGWKTNEIGQIVIEPKPVIKSRLNRSPDYADALVMALSTARKPFEFKTCRR